MRTKLYSKTVVIIGLILLLTSCSSNLNTNSVNSNSNTNIPTDPVESTETETETVIDAFSQAKLIGKALNFGNIFEGPTEGSWGITAEEEYFSLISDKGFDTLRVPIRFSNKTELNAPYTIDETFFQRIDWVIDSSLKNNLNVIIDLHHFDELISNPEAEKARLLAIWEQIATRYHDLPLNVFYELLNEPHTNMTAELWNDYLLETINTIRKLDPHRTLIVGGIEWNGINGLYKLDLPEEDRNIIATFHYYGPILFTHQGAEWMEPEYSTIGLTWPGPPATPVEPTDEAKRVQWVNTFFRQYNEREGEANPASEAALTRDLERAAKWGEDNNRPVFLGEFGAYSSADRASRIAWTQKVRTEAERLNMSWAYWEFAAGFGLYNRATSLWDEDLVGALLSPQ